MNLFGRSAAPDAESEQEHRVQGDRGIARIAGATSIQSRVSNLLAMALMGLVGTAFLAWYYTHIASHSARIQHTLLPTADRQETDMALPALGKIEPATVSASEVPATPLAAEVPPAAVTAPAPGTPGTPGAPRPSALERRLSGAAFAPGGSGTVAGASIQGVPLSQPTSSEGLGALLRSEPTRVVAARVLPTMHLLLPKGAFIDCTLETAIDSTLPGLTTCITATDTFGADGSVVLLERGTKLLGETRGEVQQASTRVFVLWTEARTPTGVVVPLDSPGADALGRSGLPGEVDRHFWQRFGAAILISTIDGATAAAVQSAGRGSGTIVYNPSGPQDVMSEVLKGTLNTPPTVIKQNGDRIQILVARDVDFSNVYELRHASTQP